MEAVNKCDVYNYLLGWKLEFRTENQQSRSKALGGGGSRSGWDLPVPAAIRGWTAASGPVGDGTLQCQPGLTVNSLGQIQSLGSWFKVGTGWLSTLERKEPQLGAGHRLPNLSLLPAGAGGGSPALSQFWSSPISLFIRRANPGLVLLTAAKLQFGCTTDKLQGSQQEENIQLKGCPETYRV